MLGVAAAVIGQSGVRVAMHHSASRVYPTYEIAQTESATRRKPPLSVGALWSALGTVSPSPVRSV